MIRFFSKEKHNDAASLDEAVIDVITRTQAMIVFKPDGTVISANENFLNTLGYSASEIVGRHHSMFVARDIVASEDYRNFWKRLAQGEHFTSQYPRVHKTGKVVWIQATYAPVFTPDGKVNGIIKLATNVTARREALEGVSQALAALRDSNLSFDLKMSGVEDIDKIAGDYGRATASLREALLRIADVASDLNETNSTILRSSSELSVRTGRQAGTLEETAAALEEITSQMRLSSLKAVEAHKIASDTRNKASASEAVVAESIVAMDGIEQSSSAISGILTVIDDIAFQTNLLALNAGVEAARAGEAGRGFAVVATEVRSLAQRTKDAAGKIKELISESSEKVTRGVGLVHSAGKELQMIIEGVTQISERVAEISNSASEQSEALNNLNASVSELDQVTQQNAGMVEEMSGSTEILTDGVQRLNDEVDAFEFGEGAVSNAHSDRQSAGGRRAA